MMTVRFSDGTSIQYNTANYASRSQHGYTDLYTKENGAWVAQVPTSSCVIEVTPACRVYNAPQDKYVDRLVAMESEIRGLKKSIRQLIKAQGA